MKTRAEIEEKYKWDLTEYCKNEEEFEKGLDEIEKQIPYFASFKGKLNTKENIFKFDEESSKLSKLLDKLAVYIQLKKAEDNSNSCVIELFEKTKMLYNKFSLATSFVEYELSQLSDEFLTELANDKSHPEFRNGFLEIIRQKPHILDKQEEELMSKLELCFDGSSDVFDMIDNVDITFDKIKDKNGKEFELTTNNYERFITSTDRTLRKNTQISLMKGYQKLNNTLSVNYINHIKEDVTLCKIYKYPDCLSEALFNEKISQKLYDTLVENVEKNLPVLFQYFDEKAKILGIKKLATFDCSVPVGKNADKKYSYEECIDLIEKALEPMGKEYVSLVKKAVNERWIDVFPSAGKDNGGFQIEAYGCHPAILINYNNTLNSISDLIHEMGHAFHTYYSDKNQPYETSEYSVFLAEIASTTNEILLTQYLIKNATSDDEKLKYLDGFMHKVQGTIYCQVMFSDFEDFAHKYYEQNGTLAKDVLNNKYDELNKKYFGDNVEIIPEMKYGWSRIPHFYRSFYVYNYATGLISAIIIANRILNNEQGFVEKYIKFLSSGSSVPPQQLLESIDINLEDEKTYDEVFGFIQKQVNELKKLRKK